MIVEFVDVRVFFGFNLSRFVVARNICVDLCWFVGDDGVVDVICRDDYVGCIRVCVYVIELFILVFRCILIYGVV